MWYIHIYICDIRNVSRPKSNHVLQFTFLSWPGLHRHRQFQGSKAVCWWPQACTDHNGAVKSSEKLIKKLHYSSNFLHKRKYKLQRIDSMENLQETMILPSNSIRSIGASTINYPTIGIPRPGLRTSRLAGGFFEHTLPWSATHPLTSMASWEIPHKWKCSWENHRSKWEMVHEKTGRYCTVWSDSQRMWMAKSPFGQFVDHPFNISSRGQLENLSEKIAIPWNTAWLTVAISNYG